MFIRFIAECTILADYFEQFSYQVVRKSDNKVYALKRVKIGKMSKKEISDALNEIRFLASIRHNNIVGFLEAFLGMHAIFVFLPC